MWVPFNEGWGQYDTERHPEVGEGVRPDAAGQLRQRLDRPRRRRRARHAHLPRPRHVPEPKPDRVSVLGEFGGLGLPLEGPPVEGRTKLGLPHLQDDRRTARRLPRLLRAAAPAHRQGASSAAVYTQTTDVEAEVNGLHDLRPRGHQARRRGHGAAGTRRCSARRRRSATLVPTSRDAGAEVAVHASTKPADGWEKPDFDDVEVEEAEGGFGTKGTPGAVVRTEWKTPDIWLRRDVRADGTCRRARCCSACTTTRTPRSTSTACWRRRWPATRPTTPSAAHAPRAARR